MVFRECSYCPVLQQQPISNSNKSAVVLPVVLYRSHCLLASLSKVDDPTTFEIHALTKQSGSATIAIFRARRAMTRSQNSKSRIKKLLNMLVRSGLFSACVIFSFIFNLACSDRLRASLPKPRPVIASCQCCLSDSPLLAYMDYGGALSPSHSISSFWNTSGKTYKTFHASRL
jgi:hypothetical protein